MSAEDSNKSLDQPQAHRQPDGNDHHHERSSDEQSSEEPSTSWWNWIESAKTKSREAYEFIKKDLNELKETVHQDTSRAVSSTATSLQYVRDTISGMVAPDPVDQQATKEEEVLAKKDADEEDKREAKNEEALPVDDRVDEAFEMFSAEMMKAKDKLSSLFGTIADAFKIKGEYDDDDEMLMVSGEQMIPVDRWKTLLKMIQTDPQTYCHEPEGPPENYESWLATFNLIDYHTQIVHLLETVPQIKEFHTQLVPNSLSDVEFWHRYYYKVHQLMEIERKRAVKIKSQENTPCSYPSTVEVKMLEKSSSLKSSEDSEENSDEKRSDAKQSEEGSDGWERTDWSELNELAGQRSEAKEDVKSEDEWVKCD